MDNIVLSEGENDLLFLRELHIMNQSSENYDMFHNEKSETKETKRITQHMIDNRYNFLYKAEGGRQNLSIIFSDISLQVLSMGMNVYILADLDGEPTSEFLSEINKYLTLDYGNSVQIIEDYRYMNTDMVILDCTLEVVTDDNMDVIILAFHDSLEEATGIHNGDSSSKKIEKIRNYIQNKSTVINDCVGNLY